MTSEIRTSGFTDTESFCPFTDKAYSNYEQMDMDDEMELTDAKTHTLLNQSGGDGRPICLVRVVVSPLPPSGFQSYPAPTGVLSEC